MYSFEKKIKYSCVSLDNTNGTNWSSEAPRVYPECPGLPLGLSEPMNALSSVLKRHLGSSPSPPEWLSYALQDAHFNYSFRWAHREDGGEWWLCQVQGYLTQGRWWIKLRINYGQNAGKWRKLPNLCMPLRGTLDILWSGQSLWNTTFLFTSEDWRSIGKHLWYPRQVNTWKSFFCQGRK